MNSSGVENTILPECITGNMFNCFEQQIMTLCKYYRGEFWKLFLKQQFQYTGKESGNICDLYDYKANILICAKEKYGIFIKEINRNEIVFDGNSMYLFELNSRFYDCTKELEKEGTHDVIVYGQDKENYLVSDNYYGYPKRIINRNELDQGVIRYYKVHLTDDYSNRIDDKDFDLFLESPYEEFSKALDAFIYSESEFSNDLIDILSLLYKHCNKISFVIREIENDVYKDYLFKCSEVIDDNVKNIKNEVYTILKSVFKDENIDYFYAKEKLTKCGKKLKTVNKVLNEVGKIIKNNYSLADILTEQLKKYANENDEVGNIQEQDDVYNTHDKLTILFFLNFLEKENEITSINYDEILKLKTYREFLTFVYKKILMC